MVLDVIVAFLLLVALFKGLKNGLVRAFLSFVGVLIGLAAAMKLSALAAGYIGQNTNISQRWLPVIAFIAVFIVVVVLVRIGARLLDNFLRLVMLDWLNRVGGVVFYLLLYLFMISILLFYAEQLNVFKPQTREASLSYPFVRPVAPALIQGMGALVPFFQNMLSDLEQFVDSIPNQPEPAR